jgi:hypothetical protein
VFAYIGKEIGHGVESHLLYKAESTKSAESTFTEAVHTVTSGFPWYGLAPALVILAGVLVVAGIVAWNLVGKGEGSHAGREEVRRSYRRELAKQMARQDAEAIKKGEKVRRRWMQW